MSKKLLLIFVACVLGAGIISAQDGGVPDDLCTAEGRQIVAGVLQRAIDKLSTSEDPSMELLTAQAFIASYRADCAGLVFTSEEYGTSVVTDPVIFPSGLYRATLESPANSGARVSLEALEGDCGFFYIYTEPSAPLKQETLRLENCAAVIEADGSDGWTMTFEPIALSE